MHTCIHVWVSFRGGQEDICPPPPLESLLPPLMFSLVNFVGRKTSQKRPQMPPHNA